MKQTRLIWCIFLALAVTIAWPSTAAAEDPVIVGVLHSEEYPYAEMMKNSFDMALAFINKNGGINGRPLKLIFGNDQGKKEPGIKTVQRLIKEDKAVMLVGAYQSSNAIYMALAAERLNRPLLICTAADDRVTQREMKNIFRLNPPAGGYTAGLEKYFLEDIRPKTMAIIYENSPYGTGGALRMMWFCRENDIEIRKIIPYHKEKAKKESIGSAYFQRLLSPLKEEPPEVIYMVSYLDDAAMLVKKIDELKLPSLLAGGAGGFTHQKFIDKVGPLANNVLTASLWAPQLRYHGTRAYYEDYVDKYTVPPDYHGAEAYSALLIAADALRRSSSSKPADIREALNQTNRMTPFGPVRFQDYDKYQRQNKLPTVVLQIHNGQFDCIYPPQHATAKFTPRPGWRAP